MTADSTDQGPGGAVRNAGMPKTKPAVALDRRKAALKANMARRKDQARARAAGATDADDSDNDSDNDPGQGKQDE